MKILAVVYRLGGNYPTGVTNRRVLDALVELGHDVFVISAPTNNNTWHNDQHHECSDFPTSPARLFTKVGNILQCDFNFIFWEKRVYSYAKRVIKKFKPDVIYARSSPSAVCHVAARISKYSGIPVVMHFTDPIPAPFEWAPSTKYRSRELKLMEEILPVAYKVSFGNSAMLNYQQSLLKYNFRHKSFISPDPSPSDHFYFSEPMKSDSIILTFLGAFHGNRKPDSLFSALNILNKNGYKFILNIYDINRYNIAHPEYIHFLGRTANIKQALINSDILVDVEGDDKTPVFISSKLKDYLCCGRPILSICIKDGPSYNLVKSLSTVVCCNNSPDDIVKSLKYIINRSYSEADFNERIPIIEQFNPNKIASIIANECQSK